MTILNSEKIKDLYLADLLYEIHTISDKIKMYEEKYKLKFKEFEQKVKTESKEKFDYWDDYLEWKAYHIKYIELAREKEDIQNGNYKISI